MKRIFILLVALSFVANTFAQDRPSTVTKNGGRASMTDYDMPVKRILWQSETGVINSQSLLAAKEGQAASAEPRPPCELKPSAGILLDFGVELQGTVKIITPELPKGPKCQAPSALELSPQVVDFHPACPKAQERNPRKHH